MLISEVLNNNKRDAECDHCMEITKDEIKKFFDYLDSDNSGQLTAHELFNNLKNLRTSPLPVYNEEGKLIPGIPSINLTSSMVNHFILINDLKHKGSISREEFVKGILLGMTERLLTDTDGFNEEKYVMMKTLRANAANSGLGPK